MGALARPSRAKLGSRPEIYKASNKWFWEGHGFSSAANKGEGFSP